MEAALERRRIGVPSRRSTALRTRKRSHYADPWQSRYHPSRVLGHEAQHRHAEHSFARVDQRPHQLRCPRAITPSFARVDQRPAILRQAALIARP